MSAARLLSARASATPATRAAAAAAAEPATRRGQVPIRSLRRFHHAAPQSAVQSSASVSAAPSSPAGGLLGPGSVFRSRRARWPDQIYRYHNLGGAAIAIRQMSFARSLPKLVLKFARIPAAFGGAAIAGLAYVQFKAER